MLIAGVLCVCAAVSSAGFALWSLARTQNVGPTALALRSVAPAQLAAAIMLTAGGVVSVAAAPQTALVLLIVCVVGAFGTLAAGSWQSARFALQQEAAALSCGGTCGGCTQSCSFSRPAPAVGEGR